MGIHGGGDYIARWISVNDGSIDVYLALARKLPEFIITLHYYFKTGY